jgi:hypothetical protein
MMDEKSANDWLRDRGKHRDAEAELMLNFDEHARRRFLKSPDDTHSARERLQVQKSNFHSLAVDDEFGGPGNWNAGAQSRHFGPRCDQHIVRENKRNDNEGADVATAAGQRLSRR